MFARQVSLATSEPEPSFRLSTLHARLSAVADRWRFHLKILRKTWSVYGTFLVVHGDLSAVY